MSFTVTNTYFRQGTSYARGTTIDEYLTSDANDALYAVWEKNPDWPEMYRFSGGITAVTCEMVLEVPEDAFLAAFKKEFGAKIGKEIAQGIREVAIRNAGR